MSLPRTILQAVQLRQCRLLLEGVEAEMRLAGGDCIALRSGRGEALLGGEGDEAAAATAGRGRERPNLRLVQVLSFHRNQHL